MSTVADLLLWADFEAVLREYLGIPSGLDAQLQRQFNIAVKAADTYIGKNDLTEVSDNIEQGILAYIESMLDAPSRAGVSSQTTGDISVTFRNSRVVAQEAASQFWFSERLDFWR